MKGKLSRFIVGVPVLAIFLLHISGLFHARILDELEFIAYDTRLRTTLSEGVDPRVVIIDIDENSLASQGGWPWPRDRFAQLNDILFEHYGVEVLGYDVVFPQASDDVATQVLETLGNEHLTEQGILELEKIVSNDLLFAESLERHNIVLGYGFGNDVASSSVGQLPDPVLSSEFLEFTNAPEASRFTSNLPMFQSVVNGGYFSLLGNIDSDGVIRRVSMFNKFQGNLYEAFSLAVARNYLGMDLEPVFTRTDQGPGLLEAIDLGFSKIVVDQHAAALVPYQGRSGSFRYVPAEDVLNKTVENPEDLSGVIGLVGTSAAGLVDLRSTPVQGIFPGVEIHANIIAGILDDSFRIQPEWSKGAEMLQVLLIGLTMIFLLPFLSATWMSVIALVIAGGVIGINYYFWSELNFIMPLANTLLLVLLLYIVNLVYGFIFESRSSRELRSVFGMYVPPEIIGEMKGKTPSSLLATERRDMTVLFTDVRDFTPIAEAFDPEELTEFMNTFLTPLTEIVHRHRGAIDKYMGDAMMAFWGAPLDDPDHAEHAIDASLAISQKVKELNVQFAEKDWPQIKIGIGLGTGDVSVGNMGSEFRMAYTVLGDAVNLGSRLEGLTKFYGVEMLVGESTAKAVPNHGFRQLDFVRVKGKQEGIKIYQPLGRSDAIDNEVLAESRELENALNHFRNQDWDEAESIFRKMADHRSEKVYDLYMERIAHYRDNPPGSGWDGIFTYNVK